MLMEHLTIVSSRHGRVPCWPLIISFTYFHVVYILLLILL
jgi:hypothetical protein